MNDWLLKKFNLRNAGFTEISMFPGRHHPLYDKSDISDDDMHRITSFAMQKISVCTHRVDVNEVRSCPVL